LSGLASVSISSSVFSGNYAGYSGGGLYVEKCGFVHLMDSFFRNNSAGVALDSSSTSASSTLDSGEILGSGGGVSSGGGSSILAQRCHFERNRCRGSDNDIDGDGVEEWTFDNCLGSEVAAAEDVILQACNLLTSGKITATSQPASVSSLVRGQRVALDGSFLVVDDENDGSSSGHMTYGVSLALDSTLSGSQTTPSSYALLSRNSPQLVNLGVVSDVNQYELSACTGDWYAINDGNPFNLRSFGVDYSPV
jgi:predicted outer membrane repeat protein